MKTIILDTNIVSELMKPEADLVVKRWLEELEDAVFVTTTVTVAEISFGIARLPVGARRSKLEHSFAALVGSAGPLPVLPLDEPAARIAGNMRALRERNGSAATFAHTSIAGIAVAHRHSLATRNVKDFDRLGVEVVDPWG
jgi:toxin FitB